MPKNPSWMCGLSIRMPKASEEETERAEAGSTTGSAGGYALPPPGLRSRRRRPASVPAVWSTATMASATSSGRARGSMTRSYLSCQSWSR